MRTEVKIPAVGESITTGLLAAWEKRDGEWVNAGEVLFLFETDKVTTEITAPQSGLLRIQIPDGTEVKIGEVVAVIQEAETSEAGGAAAFVNPPSTQEEVVGEANGEAKTPEENPLPIVTPALTPETHGAGREAPLVDRAVASEKLEEATEERITRKRLSPLRRKIATQLVTAQRTAAILTTFNECDMGAVLELRVRMQEAFQKRHGIKLGLMSIFLKAAVGALKAVPQVNTRLEGDDLIQNHYFDLGVAVGSNRGLMVPVIRDVDRKSFAELEMEIMEFAGKAREGKIKIEDLQGGVFTISNGGIYGSLLSTPIINTPQSGILGLHKIQDRPVALNNQVVIRPMMYLALSYDHRVIDGREAVTFLLNIKETIEDPVRLMLDI